MDDYTWTRCASIGVLGPSARAEAVQRFLHKAKESAPVNGWNSERGDRASLQLGLRKDVLLLHRRSLTERELDLDAHAGAALGTVMGYLQAGVSLRNGRGTSQTVGPPDVVPGEPDFAAAFAPANVHRCVAYTHALNTKTFRTDRATHAFESFSITVVLH